MSALRELGQRAWETGSDGLFACAIGLSSGLGAALFLATLELATLTRERHPALVFALPLAGFALGALYDRYGGPVRAGTGLVIERLVHDGPHLPKRMAPMVVFGTVITHLFGGSAGREGTAVQMGAGLAGLWNRLGRAPAQRQRLLRAGVAAGFGAVFGTPVAGAVFALELPIAGAFPLRSLPACAIAATLGDLTTRALRIEHTPFPRIDAFDLSPAVLARLLALAIAVALTAIAFVFATARLKELFARIAPRLAPRMALGGLAVAAASVLASSHVYLGLGVPTIVRAFREPLPPITFAGKLAFTALTLSAGFIGGEVTPLFFMGATLGNALAPLLALPLDVCAAVALAAMFGSVAKTPVALAIMAVELFGAAVGPAALLVCATAYALTGPFGIYPQRAV